MKTYNIDIKPNNDGIYSEYIDYIYYNVKPTKPTKAISLNRFIKRLNDDHWVGEKVIYNEENTVYCLFLKQYDIKLSITLPKDETYTKRYAKTAAEGIELLKQMCKDALKVRNNITDINSFSVQNDSSNNSEVNDINETNDNYEPNLKLIHGTVYKSSIRKFLQTTKGKIVLVTTVAGLVALGISSAFAIKNMIEARETLNEVDNYKQVRQTDSVPTTIPDTVSNTIKEQNKIHNAIKNGLVAYEDDTNPNWKEEQEKIQWNSENYQIRR